MTVSETNPPDTTVVVEGDPWARLLDTAVLVAVPVCLAVVGALPAETRLEYAFRYAEPGILTAFTAHFVHFTAGSLLANLLGYLLIVPTAYVLSVATGHRRRFFVVLVAFLLALPVALSWLNLAVPREGVGAGFSGINTAFLGYLAYAVLEYLSALFPDRVPVGTPWLFFASLGVAGLLTAPGLRGDATAVAALLAAALFALPTLEALVDGTLRRLRRRDRKPGQVELALLGLVVVLGYPFVAFPPDLTVDGRVVNVYVHLLGFALGFTSTYVAADVLDVEIG